MLCQTSRCRRTAAGLKMPSVPPRWTKTEIIFTTAEARIKLKRLYPVPKEQIDA